MVKFSPYTLSKAHFPISLVPRPLPDFYLAAVEKNREKSWEQNLRHNQKWWTRLVRMWTRFRNDGNVPTHNVASINPPRRLSTATDFAGAKSLRINAVYI